MQYLKNLEKLFSKDFVENPVIDSFSIGTIDLPTGRLIACDPLITNDMKPFKINFPKGQFPVTIHKEKDTNCIAYVEISFGKDPIVDWRMATTEGQNIDDLSNGEIFGYPVESGMGCFMDEKAQESLNELEQRLFRRKGDDFMGIYEEFFHEHFFNEKGAIDQYAFLKPDEKQAGNILGFETGYGEGFYASFIGFNKDHQPMKIITEFIEISVA